MYNFNPLVHLAAISESIKSLGLRGELQFDTFRFEVAGSGQYFELVPEFLAPSPDRLKYLDTITPEVSEFAGWRVAPRKNWGASDKLKFKEFCDAQRLRTPKLHALGASGDTLVLAKEKSKPAATRGAIVGPLTLSQLARNDTGKDLFAEEYIEGKSVQAWYFGGKLACVEIREKPTVTGDGKRTLRELVQALDFSLGFLPLDWNTVAALGALKDLSLDSRVPAGVVVPADIRYNSSLHRIANGDENVLPQIVGSPVHDQLVRAGPVLNQFIPEALRPHAVFSTRSVIDASSNVWFTDMDPDRYMHPAIYTAMLTGLFNLPEQVSHSVPPLPQAPMAQ
jgi:hypothetical protein